MVHGTLNNTDINMVKMSIDERMIRVETILTQVLDELREVKQEMRSMHNSYVSAEEHSHAVVDLQTQITELKAKRWVQNTLSAVLGSVLTLLLGYFVANIGG